MVESCNDHGKQWSTESQVLTRRFIILRLCFSPGMFRLNMGSHLEDSKANALALWASEDRMQERHAILESVTDVWLG